MFINLIIHQNQKKMKKLFTLAFALVAMCMCAQAQVTDDFESYTAFTVDPTGTWTYYDGDGLSTYGFNGISFENSNYTGSCIVFNPTETSPDCSANYAAHSGSQYLIIFNGVPDDETGVSETNDWIISPALSLSGAALLTFYAREITTTYGPEVMKVWYSTTTNTPSAFTLLQTESVSATTWTAYTYTIPQNATYVAISCNSEDVFGLLIDDISIIEVPTTPTIMCGSSSLNFGTVILGQSNEMTATVTAYNLTTGITATTAAPFAVSADGETYATTATVAATGGTLYLQYAPTTVGTQSGTVTLASTGATDVTITLAGSGFDCGNNPIPYSYSFTDAASNQCWEIVDANEDGHTFSFDVSDGTASYSYSTTSAADDWLISPLFTITGNEVGSFDYAAFSSSYPEKFQVFAIGSNDTMIALTGVVDVTSATNTTQYFDFTGLTGSYHVGIHCISNANMWDLIISNFAIGNGMPQASLTLSTDTLDFGPNAMGTTSDPKVVILNTVNVNEAFTLTVTAPYEVSLDGTTFATTQTIPANAAISTADSIFVRFAPTAVGTFDQSLTISSTTYNETVALLGSSVDCSLGITSLPYTFGFDDPIAPPLCWTATDPENYSPGTISTGNYACVFLDADMLVTPEIHPTDAMLMTLDYVSYFGSEAEESTIFRIGYSSTNNNASDFTWQDAITADQDQITTLTTVIPANTKYIAIELTQMGYGLYYGILEYNNFLFIDNLTLTALNEPMLLVSSESLDFGSIMLGANVVKNVSVTGAQLTSDITVTAPANFEVSSTGTSYAATTTLSQNGGTLYVRYNPTAAGSHTGTVALNSGSTSKTIAVSGSATDCSTPRALPFNDYFDEGLDACWTILDVDGDGYSWESSLSPVSYFASSVNLAGTGYDESYGFVLSGSYSNVYGALTPDNWLITPALIIPSQGAELSFYITAQDASYANEHYGVYVSTTGTNPSDFTLLYEETIDANGGPRAQGAWKQKHANLPYGGQNIYIAIRHFNVSDMFLLDIDNFSVTPGLGVENHGVKTVVYPNPVNNVLNIEASANINRVEVYNMMGQMVGNYKANDVNTQINTSSFANGIYTVKIETENGTTTQKFTVAR